MKALHRPDLFAWTRFDEARDIDFHGYAWIRADGNVLVDPLPMSAHDLAHLERLGGVSTIVVTNSDHVRATLKPPSASVRRRVGPSPSVMDFRSPAPAGFPMETSSSPVCARSRSTGARPAASSRCSSRTRR